MATEYKLSYTASEINRRLGLVDELSEYVDEKLKDIENTSGNGVSSWNDLTDKPFYTEEAWKELMPETALPFTLQQDISAFYTTPTTEMLEMYNSEWSKALVLWDGVEYECKPKSYYGIKAIGNVELMDGTGDSGEPFIVVVDDGTNTGGSPMAAIISGADTMNQTATATHTVGISFFGEDVHPLDSKFIDDVSWSKISDKPFYEIPSGTVVVDESVTIQSGITPLAIDLEKLVAGAPYSITINNDTYTATADGDGSGNVAIDVSSDGQDIFLFVSSYRGFFSDTLTVGETYNIKIAFAQDYAKTIDSKYLPSGLPEVTTEDNDKVLKVVDGEWLVSEAPSGIPDIADSDEGKFLRIVNGVAVWQTVSKASEVQF